MTKFEVGKKYYMASACDRNCTWVYEVARRTAKTVILTDGTDKPSRFRISVWDDIEHVKPLGTYSMSPILSADRGLIEKPSREAARSLGVAAPIESSREGQEIPGKVLDFTSRLKLRQEKTEHQKLIDKFWDEHYPRFTDSDRVELLSAEESERLETLARICTRIDMKRMVSH